MQRIRGPFVLATVLNMWIDPLCNDTPSLDHFIRFLFIFVPTVYKFYIYLPHSNAFFTSYFTFIYRPTRNIFLIPDDAVDRRKLGFYGYNFLQ